MKFEVMLRLKSKYQSISIYFCDSGMRVTELYLGLFICFWITKYVFDKDRDNNLLLRLLYLIHYADYLCKYTICQLRYSTVRVQAFLQENLNIGQGYWSCF